MLCSSSSDPKSQCFKRHTLNYLQEIGNGWFGKVTHVSPTLTSAMLSLLTPDLDPRQYVKASRPPGNLLHVVC